MKILHVLDTSIPDMSGYTTRAHYLITNQCKLGVEPIVLTSERLSDFSGQLEESIDKIQYYRSVKQNGLVRKIPFMAELDEIRTLARRVAEVAIREKVDIVHAHSPSLIGAACLDHCRRNAIPLVYEIRAFWEDAAVDRGAFAEDSFKYVLRRRHETKIAKAANAVIAICDGIKTDLVERGLPRDKIHVVPNGVDHELFKPLSVDMKLKENLGCMGKIVIGFIGSFFHFEGLQDLIRAMPAIIKENKNVTLLLVGKGQMDKKLRELTSDMGLENRIIFTGRVPHDQVARYYSIIDVLVYPRINKRITNLVTPLKPLEAMSMEKTVLMSDVGGLRELADAVDVAAFFKADDVHDLAKQCLALCNSPERRTQIGRNARLNIMARWGWEKRAKADINLYRTLAR